MQLEVLFTPAEFARLPERDLSDTACVVIDVFRATSTMVTALTNGARAIRPVGSIEQALAVRRDHPDFLLAGEREGLRIGPELTGGIGFHLGNSPREFTAEAVAGRTIIMTTTNGTRALQACIKAPMVMAAAFLNMDAVAETILRVGVGRVLLVCSGTGDELALEDALAAGALCAVLEGKAECEWLDSARFAHAAWRGAEGDWVGRVRAGRNGRRLLALPTLADDVAFCCHRSLFRVVPMLCEGVELRGFGACSPLEPRIFTGKPPGP